MSVENFAFLFFTQALNTALLCIDHLILTFGAPSKAWFRLSVGFKTLLSAALAQSLDAFAMPSTTRRIAENHLCAKLFYENGCVLPKWVAFSKEFPLGFSH